jgi:colicin import membrane protein
MDAAADRPEFEPPKPPGFLRALALALLAHALLMVALTWGVRWNREAQDLAAEAELWSSVPQEAAPKVVVAPPPPPPPPPRPVPREEPKPEPKPNEADIAAEREKQKREVEKKRQAEEEERKERQRKRAEEQERKREEQAKLAAENRKKEEELKRKEKAQEQRVAKLREENLERMRNLAGGAGSPTSRGTAAQSSGPSQSWAGRVRARVKPNIVFADVIPGNPTAEVEVRLAPDGTIVSKRVVKSSGHAGWDQAVLRALDKTEVLPRDTDGRVPTPVILEFRPKD